MKTLLLLVLLPVSAFAALSPPSNLTGGSISKSEIKLNWKDNTATESGFQVFMSEDGVGYNSLGNLPKNTVSFVAGNLAPGTKYWFKVRAYAGNNTFSNFSNTIARTTNNPPVSPSPSPTATPTPTPTATPTPATPTPSPSPTPSPTPTPTPTPATPSPTPTATPTPSPSPTPTPTATPVQMRTVTVEIINPTVGDNYELYYGEAAGIYGSSVATLTGAINAGIPNLTVGTTYYFSSKTIRNGVESAMGDPVIYTVTPSLTQRIGVP